VGRRRGGEKKEGKPWGGKKRRGGVCHRMTLFAFWCRWGRKRKKKGVVPKKGKKEKKKEREGKGKAGLHPPRPVRLAGEKKERKEIEKQKRRTRKKDGRGERKKKKKKETGGLNSCCFSNIRSLPVFGRTREKKRGGEGLY